MSVSTMILKWVPLQTRLGLILATLVIETLQTSGMTHPSTDSGRCSKEKRWKLKFAVKTPNVSHKKIEGCECDSNWVNQVFKKFADLRGTFLSVILCIDDGRTIYS